MKPLKFPRPGISLGVLRRQLAAELIDLAYLLTEFLSAPARTVFWRHCWPSATVYSRAAARLRQAGFLAYRRTRGRPPEMRLTTAGDKRISDVMVPELFWKRRWDGVWYLLAYDVPEKERRYRSALWYLLAHFRLGCLQKSVWIAARDIRPLFYDLDAAAAVGEYALIFAARTVLNISNTAVAVQAWDFERLETIQTAYLREITRRAAQESPRGQPQNLLPGLRLELAAYLDAMRRDPLLPAVLWPAGYLGPRVVAAFRRRIRQLLARGLDQLI